MKLLAIDTSSPATIVVAASGDALAERRHQPVGRERPQHTTSSLVLAEQALNELTIGWGQLDRVGVGIGPGSFTGLRSGLSAAAGVARAAGIGLVAVSTTAQLEHGARAAFPDAATVLAVVDGRRGELFAERFEAPGQGGGVQRIARGELALLGSSDALVIGDGALLEREALLALGFTVPAAADPVHQLAGGALAALTAAGTAQSPDLVRPAYGRAPDAIPTAEREAARR